MTNMFRVKILQCTIKVVGFLIFLTFKCTADWVEIPQLKPHSVSSKPTGSTYYSGSKTPVDVVFREEQVENVEAFNTSANNWKSREDSSRRNVTNKKITTKPAKSYIIEVFSSTTQFTPLMSSVGVILNSPTTEAPLSRNTLIPIADNKPEKKKSNFSKFLDKDQTEDASKSDSAYEDYNNDDIYENKTIPETNVFSTYMGFLPFLKSVQKTLMQKAHKSIKSKIQVLRDLRDTLLHDIDQRIKKLWSASETYKTARGYHEESHLEFPSNESALMTIGFLTLAVFLVKLVLKVITAVKAKAYYYGTSTTTAASTGRKRRSAEPDEETTYRILSSIENYKNNYDYNQFNLRK